MVTTTKSAPISRRFPTCAYRGPKGSPATTASSSEDGLISVLPGIGDGSFGDRLNFNTGGAAPTRVVVADFNGDKRPDVAVVNSRNDTVGVLLNTAK